MTNDQKNLFAKNLNQQHTTYTPLALGGLQGSSQSGATPVEFNY